MSTEENSWWSSLHDKELYDNAYGIPPYNVVAVAEFIESYCDLEGDILDIGCGPGRLGHTLATRNLNGRFVGIDVSRTMVEAANKLGSSNWIAQINDGQFIPFRFPLTAAYSVTVFQHLSYSVVQNYINQVHNLLLPGGVFLFSYAVGHEDTFLSHQVSDIKVEEWLQNFNTINFLETPNTHPNWNWVRAIK